MNCIGQEIGGTKQSDIDQNVIMAETFFSGRMACLFNKLISFVTSGVLNSINIMKPWSLTVINKKALLENRIVYEWCLKK